MTFSFPAPCCYLMKASLVTSDCVVSKIQPNDPIGLMRLFLLGVYFYFVRFRPWLVTGVGNGARYDRNPDQGRQLQRRGWHKRRFCLKEHRSLQCDHPPSYPRLWHHFLWSAATPLPLDQWQPFPKITCWRVRTPHSTRSPRD